MIETLKREDFSELPPGSLQAVHAGLRVTLSVAETRDIPAHSPRAYPFAVVVEGPASPFLPQGMHALMHPRLGKIELFMVPLDRDTRHARYELIFN